MPLLTSGACAPAAVDTTPYDAAAAQLAHAADRLADLVHDARAIAASTDWHSRAARVFHDRAEEWAADVAALESLAHHARYLTVAARATAIAGAEWGCG